MSDFLKRICSSLASLIQFIFLYVGRVRISSSGDENKNELYGKVSFCEK